MVPKRTQALMQDDITWRLATLSSAVRVGPCAYKRKNDTMYSISGDAHSPMLLVVLVLEAPPFKCVTCVAVLLTTRCDSVSKWKIYCNKFWTAFWPPVPQRQCWCYVPSPLRHCWCKLPAKPFMKTKIFNIVSGGKGRQLRITRNGQKQRMHIFNFCCNIFSMHGTSGGVLEPQLMCLRMLRMDVISVVIWSALAFQYAFMRCCHASEYRVQ